MKHNLETEEFKKAYQNIERNNRDLLFNHGNEKSKVKDLGRATTEVKQRKIYLRKDFNGRDTEA